ncbi:MAG: hypothetical protein AB7J13_03155 [Pyrinomonadaceae bacterium]
MNNYIKRMTYFMVITAMITLGTVMQAQTQQRAYRVNDRQLQNLLNQIESKTNTFKQGIERSLNRSVYDGTRREDSINQMISDFENATDRLKSNFSSRRPSAQDVQEVLNRAVRINSFMSSNQVSQPSQNLWGQIRQDLNTLAGYYRVTSTWDNNANLSIDQSGYTATDTEMRTLLNRLQSRTNSFIQSYNRWNRNTRNRQVSTASNVQQNITDYTRALTNLRNTYKSRNSNAAEILRPAAEINQFVTANRLNNTVTNRWTLVRNDLSTLSTYYRTAMDWNGPYNPYPGTYSGVTYGNFDSQLTGSYRLNTGRSENVRTVVDRAITDARYQPNQADRMRSNLERRLASPETLSFEKRGQQVTMATANTQSVSLTADGVKRNEMSPNGRSATTTVMERNGQLAIDYEGDRMNDFHLTFTPVGNSQLRVTRRIYLENNNQSVTVASVYDKTNQSPQWSTAYPPVYSGGTNGPTKNGFIIPNNTALLATLDSPLSTRTAQDGDRFTMTVSSPSQYSGAVIEGNVIGKQSGVVSGRATMSLNFTSIKTRDGNTHQFAGIIDEVREVNGNIISVDNEGAVRDRSQTTQTATRAGIGAVLGAIIGAIAGGGSGAAIGAGVGAGAGAGTVILQGRDNLDLERGTQFAIKASAPSNVGIR